MHLPGAKALAGSFAMSRFAGHSAPGKTPGKRPVAKTFSIFPGLLPLTKCNISCSACFVLTRTFFRKFIRRLLIPKLLQVKHA